MKLPKVYEKKGQQLHNKRSQNNFCEFGQKGLEQGSPIFLLLKAYDSELRILFNKIFHSIKNT